MRTPITAFCAAALAALAAAPAAACSSDPADIFFASGSARIAPADRGRIAAQAFYLAQLGEGARIRLSAHADRAGGGWDNLRLSRRRAEAVRDALVAEGAPASRIDILNRGEAAARVPTKDGAPEPRNRLVTIAAYAAAQLERLNPVPGCQGAVAR